MKDYIVFTVSGNHYALDVSHIERIIQVPAITPIPNAHPFIEGMISYEKRVTKVVSFRKMTNLPSYEEEFEHLFAEFKQEHEIWVDALQRAVEKQEPFSFATDLRSCRLGKWLDTFSTQDTEAVRILKTLRPAHLRFHETAKEVLELCGRDRTSAGEQLRSRFVPAFEFLIQQLEALINTLELIVGNMQKLLIYRNGDLFFAIKVDAIEDIANIDMEMFKQVDSVTKIGAFLESEGVVELEEQLVNVIKSVQLPVKEVA